MISDDVNKIRDALLCGLKTMQAQSKAIELQREKIQEAINIAITSSSDHKSIIDQMLRVLAGNDYDKIVGKLR